MSISNITKCTFEEIVLLKNYLKCTPVNSVITYIENGANVSKGHILSTSDLGDCSTIWNILGGVKSSIQYSVKDVYKILSDNPNTENKKLIDKINYYKKLYESGGLDIIITFIKNGNICHIIDGDTRAVSIYEYNKGMSKEEADIPVYLISV